MYVIRHSLCYPMGYDLPSPYLAQSLHPAYAMPPPAIGAPSPLLGVGPIHLSGGENKRVMPATGGNVNKVGCNC